MTDVSHLEQNSRQGGQLHGLYVRGVKRGVDLALCLILSLPVLLIVAILVVLVRLDGGPGFFGHRRVGQDGRSFLCWKIRTMVPGAQAVLEKHLAENPDAAAEWHKDFKLRDDPRITKLGELLRASSLDELPQFWNVLRGDMSFVGPRPITTDELERYDGYKWSYLSIKPGITGLWQVSGRNSITYEERVSLDVRYASCCSPAMDLWILCRTFGAVIRKTGM